MSREIIKIYFSNQSFGLKNARVCRLIGSEFPRASFVSILLYNAEKNKLQNFGHYINTKLAIDARHSVNDSMVDMLKNLIVFEYLSYKTNTGKAREASFKEFRSSFFVEKSDYTLDKQKFGQIKSQFLRHYRNQTKYELYDLYKRYKKAIAEKDEYDLDNNEYESGKYFNQLVLRSLRGHEQFRHVIDSTLIDSRKKTMINIYEQLGVRVNPNSAYLAIPLYVDERYIGIIRFLWRSKRLDRLAPSETKKDQIWRFLLEQREAELEKFADIVALHVENATFKYEFQELTKGLQGDDLTFATQQMYTPLLRKNFLKEFCNVLRRSVNCRGCMVRIPIGRNLRPSIVGWSSSLLEYAKKRIKNDHFEKHYEALTLFFRPSENPTKDKRLITIIGARFDVDKDGVKFLTYLYLTEDRILSSSSKIDQELTLAPNINTLYNKNITTELNKQEITQVTILAIPHLSNAYVTFGSSIYRPITDQDIKIVFGYIERLGSEIALKRNILLDKKGIRLTMIAHELEYPVVIAKKMADEMVDEVTKITNNDLPEHQLVKSVKQLIERKRRLPINFKQIMDFMSWLIIQKTIINEIDQNILQVQKCAPYDFSEKMRWIVQLCRHRAQKNKLGIVFNGPRSAVKVEHDDRIFLGLFFNLVFNAIKFSFIEADRIKKVTGYISDPKAKSDGHIHVDCFSTKTTYGYKITNWGKRIKKEEKEKIFEPGYRSEPDPEFESIEEPTLGEGLGLYYAKKYAELLAAHIDIEHHNFKTSFKVSWNHQNI